MRWVMMSPRMVVFLNKDAHSHEEKALFETGTQTRCLELQQLLGDNEDESPGRAEPEGRIHILGASLDGTCRGWFGEAWTSICPRRSGRSSYFHS